MTDFRSGDLAMVQCADDGWRPAFYHRPYNAYANWRFADGLLRDAGLSLARRLAVIDPEDREQVERLAAAYVAAADQSTPPYGVGKVDMDAVADSMQAALREYATPKPPKPDEPTGLGAVVEDANGVRWVRRSTHPARSWSADTGSFQKSDDWSNIDAVRVLSPGVEVES